jgi:hypothetical protein
MTFEEWYKENVEYMHIADFKPWLHEAFDAGVAHEREACAYLRKEIPLKGAPTEEYENGFWDALEMYETAIRVRSEP